MPVPSKMADLFTIAASNSPAGSDLIGNSLDDYIRSGFAILRSTNALASASIAAASTTDLSTADAESVQITGTATINSLGTAVPGLIRECRFAASCTLANSSAIALPNAANITTNPGDVITFRSIGAGNWVMVAASVGVYGYLPTTGGTMTGALTVSTSGSINSIIVQDTGVSGANLKLIGDGASTPNKYIRAHAGNLEFINSNYASVIATLTDAGGFSAAGSIGTTGNVTGSSVVASTGAYTSGASTVTLQSGSAGSIFLRPNNGSATGQVTISTNGTVNLAGPEIITTSGLLNSFQVTDQGSNGANIKLLGDGATTPSKTIRAKSGQLQFVNDGYSGIISTLSDAGVWTAADFQATSDLRLKPDWRLLKRGIAELRKMPPIEYTKEGRPELGFGAQHAQKVIPEAVGEDANGHLVLSYGQTLALVAGALLQLVDRLEEKGVI